MTGPSEENLDRLFKMLPSMAKGVGNGRIGGKGSSIIRYPRFSCPACMKVWGKPFQKHPPVHKNCRECDKCLQAGGIIFICMDDRFVRVTPKSGKEINPSYAGKILRLTVEAMTHFLSHLPSDPSDSPATPPPDTAE